MESSNTINEYAVVREFFRVSAEIQVEFRNANSGIELNGSTPGSFDVPFCSSRKFQSLEIQKFRPRLSTMVRKLPRVTSASKIG